MHIRSYTIFSTLHPSVILFYALGAPVLSMLGMHPVFLLVEFVCAICVHLFYLGRRSTLDGLKGVMILLLVVTLLNMLTNPMGVTELFKIGSRLFTLESLGYGLTSGLMLGVVILWFRCFTALVSNDKFLYLFGSKFQTTALLLSIILKLFPETHYKIRCIKLSEDMDINNKKESLKKRLQRSMRQVSSLLEWSMEDGIETADSMRARGYGERRRGCYQKFCFGAFDLKILICLILSYSLSIFVLFMQIRKFSYYPKIVWNIEHPVLIVFGFFMMIFFLLMPIWLEILKRGGSKRWV